VKKPVSKFSYSNSNCTATAWGIPPGGTLLFEIEVLSIKGKGGEL
jgi:hypothetical protein